MKTDLKKQLESMIDLDCKGWRCKDCPLRIKGESCHLSQITDFICEKMKLLENKVCDKCGQVIK